MSDFNDFIDLVDSIDDKHELADLLLGITTPKERVELARRIDVVNQLLQGLPQKSIANKLGVGVATVTRGSKELSNGRFKCLRAKYAVK